MSSVLRTILLRCAAVAWALPALAQPPAVVGVADASRSYPVVFSGSPGYVLGSDFGRPENTIVTVAGRRARTLAVSGNEIRVLFPPDLPAGPAELSVSVNGVESAPVSVLIREPESRRPLNGRTAVLPGPPTPAPSSPAPRLSTQTSAAASGSGIVYTCDPTVTAVSSTACNVLNTTIAALYSSAFPNINASIYVQLGSTALGSSSFSYNLYTYTEFRNALVATQSGSNDATAIAGSVPTTNPYSGKQVGVVHPLERALGLSSTSCLPANSCYDGTITISNSKSLYFRSGVITGSQYDFFTVVEHETDEILGTASCTFDCTNTIFPPDLFRYHSDGTRSFAAGTNTSCAASASTNACFSLDGASMLQQYNNINNGEDAGDWTNGCTAQLVQDAVLCAGKAGLDISPAAEILVLDVIGYSTGGSSPPPGTVTNVTSPASNGTYGAGSVIPIQITFDESVIAGGVPQLALNSGGIASYSSGSGTSTLTFLYTVAAGQNSAHLDYTSATALTLNGGSIQGSGGGMVSLTLPSPGAAGSLGANKAIAIGTTTSITIQTNPSGLAFTVDGGAARTAPQTLSLAQGSHTIAVAATQAGASGTQYVFTSWSDGGAVSHTINVGASSATYTASFKVQYQLLLTASPSGSGTLTPSSGGFYDSGTVVPVTAAAGSGFTFSSWSGGVANPGSASTTISMSGPQSITASFSPAGGVAIATNPPGLLFSVDGSSVQVAPQVLNLSPGAHTLAVAATQPGAAATQYVFSSWSDGGGASHTITVGSSPATYTATFRTQYQLTTLVSPAAAGTVTPASGGFYDSGSAVPISATASASYSFSSWTGNVGNASLAATTVTMSGPQSVTAVFSMLSGVTIQTDPPGLQFSVDGGLTRTAPQTLNLAPGSHTIAVTTLETGPTGTRYAFLNWNDGGAASHLIFAGSTPATYTARFIGIGAIAGGALSVPSVGSLSSNAYFTIFGPNLAAAPRELMPSDLVNGILPTNLASTCVTVDGARAFPTYVSQTQINAIAPVLANSGSAAVSVLANCGTPNEIATPAFTAPLAAASPELLYWVQNADGHNPVIAVDALGGDYIGQPGLIPGLTFRVARGGDVLTIYGISFGATIAGPVPGTLPAAADSATPGYSLTLGNSIVPTLYVGVTPGSAGLYQVNVTVPQGLAPGNYPIVLNVNGVSTSTGAYLAIGL